ncbi:MAG: hypothetical protein BRD50_08255 [Bacteroidetes bacterium SW_11_45_7]|nr:MAG: hypothetical protein BRD50_08255 [Bacteroidetes bacterium SW_11_45_7]
MSDTGNQENKRYQEVDKYLRSQMNADEQAAFEAEMEQDPSLQEEVEQGRIFLWAMESLDEDELRKDLMRTNHVIHKVRQTSDVQYESTHRDNQHIEKGTAKVRSLTNLYKNVAAAAAILIVFIIPVYFLFLQNPGPEELVDRYYKTYPNTLTEIKRSESEADGQLQSIMALYESGDYTKAIAQSNKLLQDEPENNGLRFYRGIMYIEEDAYKKAIKDLERVKAQEESYHTQAEWYLALSHLALQQTEQAKPLLEKLAQTPSDYQQKADQLLARLED